MKRYYSVQLTGGSWSTPFLASNALEAYSLPIEKGYTLNKATKTLRVRVESTREVLEFSVKWNTDGSWTASKQPLTKENCVSNVE